MHPYRTPILAAGTAALVLGGTLIATALPSSAAATAVAPAAVGDGFWHTSGNKILDSAGNVVRIAGVN